MYKSVVGISAFAVAALAAPGFNAHVPDTVTAGQAVPLSFHADGPVTITLLNGCPSNCMPVPGASYQANGGSFALPLSSSLAASCDYGLSISGASGSDYSNHFCVAGASSSSAASPATTSAVSQIADGQPQAQTSAAAYSPAPVSQISDHQPQAPTSAAAAATSSAAAGPAAYTPAPVYTPAASPVSTPASYTGAASQVKAGMGLAAVAGVFALL